MGIEKQQADELQYTEAEVIETNAGQFSQMITVELKKFDPITPAIKELEKEFLPLKINGVEDTEGYETVTKALRLMVSKRTAVEAKRKELKADALAFGRAVDAKAASITESMAHIESHLRTEKETVDMALKAIEEEKERQKQAMIDNRKQQLFGIGMRFGMNMDLVWEPAYLKSIQPESLPFINLETMSDEAFAAYKYMVEDMQNRDIAEKLRLQAEQEAQEQQRRLEQERLQEQQRALQAEQEKMRLEMEKMNAERMELRKMQLEAMGLTLQKHRYLDEMWFSYGHIHLVSKDAVSSADTASFDALKEVLKGKVEMEKQLEAERKAEMERIAAEAQQKALEHQKQQQAEAERLEQERLKQEQAEAERLEQERIAALSDNQRIQEYLDIVLAVPRPEVKSPKAKARMAEFYRVLDGMYAATTPATKKAG